MRYLAIDTETSGLSPERHAIVSLAISLFEDGEPVETQDWQFGVVKGKEYDVLALKISGTSWKTIEAGAPERVIYNAVDQFLVKHEAHDLLLVSHNAKFDASFVDEWHFRCGDWDRTLKAFAPVKSLFSGPWACTRRMASRLLPLENFKLDTVSAFYGLSRDSEVHGSAMDAQLCGRIYHRMGEGKDVN